MSLPSPDERSVSAEERHALVALSLIPGVGPGRLRALVARFGGAQAALAAAPAALSTVPGIGPRTAAAIANAEVDALVEEQLHRAARTGAVLLPAWDHRFPALLRQIYDPPAFMWVRGSETGWYDDLQAPSLAIVGTRRATAYGRQAAYAFARELAGQGFTIVSGLAYGVDAAAHRGALEAGGRTLAVLGSGVDRIYPQAHTRLTRRITEQGALLSEYPMGAAPDAPNFPRRNRIISGLTLGTLVVEAFETGGALITARLALEQNREVFAVPSPLHSPAGVGANRLIQRGYAKLVLSVEDVLEELGMALEAAGEGEDEADLPDLTMHEHRLLEALGTEPVPIEALCTHTGLDSATALVHLLSLEFKGLVRQMAGQQFFRA